MQPQLQQTSRNKFREADAAKEQAQREWAMANSLITDEMGGGKLSRALALERRLVDTGYVNLPAARRAVTAKAAQDGVDQSRLSVLPEGLDVWHFDGDGRPAAAKITKVHHNLMSCHTTRLHSTTNMSATQTATELCRCDSESLQREAVRTTVGRDGRWARDVTDLDPFAIL